MDTNTSAFADRYPNLTYVLELLAQDNGLTVRDNILIAPKWGNRFDLAEKQATSMRHKTIDAYLQPADSSDVEDDEDALEVLTSGEHSTVEKLIEKAGVLALHRLLDEAFDGVLHTTIFVTGRMRNVR